MSCEAEDRRLREDFLQQPMLWAAADNYFSKNWQAREMLADLKQSGADIRLVQELALWSFHPLGKAEAEQKRAPSIFTISIRHSCLQLEVEGTTFWGGQRCQRMDRV